MSLFYYLKVKVYNFEVEGNHNYYVYEKGFWCIMIVIL
ncbi:hypothetical protein [Chryseobacterium arthrosphaerae]